LSTPTRKSLPRRPHLAARKRLRRAIPPSAPPLLKAALVTALVAAAFVGASVHAPRAQAASPCWKVLLNDWYDGRIDHTYPVHCYREALKHLPADVQTYSSAHDDIQRALQSAEAKIRAGGGTVSANSEVPPPGGSATTTNETSGHGGDEGNTTTTTAGGAGKTTPGGLSGVAQDANPSSASSVPLPLIILGALALLLVAAGAAGLIAKRVQARKPNNP